MGQAIPLKYNIIISVQLLNNNINALLILGFNGSIFVRQAPCLATAWYWPVCCVNVGLHVSLQGKIRRNKHYKYIFVKILPLIW